MRQAFLVLASAWLAFMVVGQDPCALNCSGHGKCVNETANFTDHPKDENGNDLEFLNVTQVGGQSCDCDHGWTDVNCSTTVEFCDSSQHVCYHGGKCVKGREESSGQVVHTCDCRTAVDGGIAYLGAYCQKPSPINHPNGETAVANATVCNTTSRLFCLNGGKCIDSYIPGEDACDCDNGYLGFHCEFHTSQLPDATTRNCITDCNKGTCHIGYRNSTAQEIAFNLDLDPNNLIEFEHCQCPLGTSGMNCEHDSWTCESGGNSRCVRGVCENVDIGDTGSQSFVCTCKHNGTQSVAGFGCSRPATSFCTLSPGVNGRQFCTNEGKCSLIGDGIYGCNCTNGFRGPHCEFPPTLPLPEMFEECDLMCDHSGVCAEGLKDHGMLVGLDDIEHLINLTSTVSNEHCLCPTGFAGNLCEHVVQVCPENKHVCFHGSDCVADGDDYKCDCSGSQDESGDFTAGKYCQHKATSVCDEASDTFCVNNGVCNGGDCDCPDPYTGPRCEFKLVVADIDPPDSSDLPENYQDPANPYLIIFTACVTVLGILAVIVVVAITGAHQERSDPEIVAPPLSAFAGSQSSVVSLAASENDSLPEASVSVNSLNAPAEEPSQKVDSAETKDDNEREIL